jgi:AcrR family transcriptional regulator
VDLSSDGRRGDARDRLLARLLEAFDEALPSPDVSLREIAVRTETSHALLRYHFGSLSGVLAAMLTAQRSRDNERLAHAAHAGTFAELVAAIWHAYAAPERLSRVRGFFHVVGLAAYNPAAFAEFIESLDDLTKMLASLAERDGLDPVEAMTTATVAIAALRGLLLQEVLGQAINADASLELIMRMSQAQARDRRARTVQPHVPPTLTAGRE